MQIIACDCWGGPDIETRRQVDHSRQCRDNKRGGECGEISAVEGPHDLLEGQRGVAICSKDNVAAYGIVYEAQRGELAY